MSNAAETVEDINDSIITATCSLADCEDPSYWELYTTPDGRRIATDAGWEYFLYLKRSAPEWTQEGLTLTLTIGAICDDKATISIEVQDPSRVPALREHLAANGIQLA